MTEAQELLLRERLQVQMQDALVTGRSLGSPVYFENIQDYWTTYEDYDTQDEIELNNIKMAVLRFGSFTDDPATPADSPLTTYNYSVYLFSQYDVMREDESDMPDPIKRRQLKVYNDFIATIMRFKTQFQGILPIPGLGSDFTVKETMPVTVEERVQERVECLYIPRVVGFSIVLGLPTRIQLREC